MNPLKASALGRQTASRACLLALLVLAPLSVAACSHAATTQPGTAAVATARATMTATMAAANAAANMPDAQSAEVRTAAWAGRPDFTGTDARTEEAYRYAFDHPQVLQWMPCYCGCGATGHRSNLDCYFDPRSDGSIKFEEHASYCDVCVNITLRAKQLVASGSSLASVRTTIDAEFGGTGPGTDTARPVS